MAKFVFMVYMTVDNPAPYSHLKTHGPRANAAHTPCTVTGSLRMYFKLTEAPGTNRLATEFLKLWRFISLSMKCESVFLTNKKRKRKVTANVFAKPTISRA